MIGSAMFARSYGLTQGSMLQAETLNIIITAKKYL